MDLRTIQRPVRIGIVGGGFIPRNFSLAIAGDEQFAVSRVLTRRRIDDCTEFPRPDLLTNSLEDLIESCDIVLECSGDPIHATDVVDAALSTERPVATMNAEFHVTAGSYFVGRGVVTEAEGDQPGCIASLVEDAVTMGFRPIVYGNMKGFLNHTPAVTEMKYWGAKQGISLPMVTAFTDGTKVQVEQALVANAFGATILQPGMLGPREDDLLTAANLLGDAASDLGQPISDYVLSGALPHGVFVVAQHDEEQRAALAYYKMGEGPYYTLIRKNILVHLEIVRTLRRVASGRERFLDNSTLPTVSVASIAKRKLEPGTRIDHAIGSFDVRGATVRIADAHGHVPVGLLANAVLTRRVAGDEVITFDDVELPETLALTAWREIERVTLSESVAEVVSP